MSVKSSSLTPQSLRNAARSRRASRSRCATSVCIAGSKRLRSLSWMARHSGRLRAHTPGGSNPCRMASTLSTAAQRRAQLLRDHRQIAAEVTGLIDEIDEILPDHALDRIGHRQRKLLGEMVDQRGLHRNEGFEIVVAVVAAAGAGRAPSRNSPPAPRRSSARSRHRHRREARPRDRHASRSRVDAILSSGLPSCQSGAAACATGMGFAIRRPPIRLPVALADLAPAADCARARPPHRPPGPDWRAAAA